MIRPATDGKSRANEGGTVAFSEQLVRRIRSFLSQRKGIEEKRMFGCVGFLVRGHVFVGVWKDSLIVRIGQDAYEDSLLEPYVRAFDITGKPMKGWAVVEPRGIETDGQLHAWIERTLKFSTMLPKKRVLPP
ncbi:MAG: TfoX/Sxy family protein [Gemmataceae bacterium]